MTYDSNYLLSTQDDASIWWKGFVTAHEAGQVTHSVLLENNLVFAGESGAIKSTEWAATVINVLRHTPALSALCAVAARQSPEKLKANLPLEPIIAAFSTKLARYLIVNFILVDQTLEKILTQARRALLLQFTQLNARELNAEELSFCFALAQQCYLNEYVYWAEADEVLAAEILAANVEAMSPNNGSSLLSSLAVLTTYKRPLDVVAFSTIAPLTDTASSEDARGFLVRTVQEPEEERRIAEALPSLTPINDPTSHAVRGQYEENPYPRWKLVKRPRSVPWRDALHTNFPAAKMGAFEKITQPRILIAGCGTGQSIAGFASLFEGAHVTGIDLSRASLAYAKRQTDALGLQAEYAQADILELESLNLRFDIIDCSGVLHHTADVERSWRSLNQCLRPGGVMRVSLYNRGARTWTDTARREVKNKRYLTTPVDIRRFRRDVLKQINTPGVFSSGLWPLANCPDFYSLSMLRDLCFHVQEQEFSIDEIEALLARLGLHFLGLTFQSDFTVRTFQRAFGHEPNAGSIETFKRFEQQFPEVSESMYNIHVQKPV